MSDKKRIIRELDRRRSISFECVGDSMTEQSHKDSVNINKLFAKYQNTGVMGNQRDVEQLKFGDFSEAFDFQKAQNKLLKASVDYEKFAERFDDLPSTTRKRFENNPKKLLDFLADERNMDEARKLGLVAPLPDKIAPQGRSERSEGRKKVGESPHAGAPEGGGSSDSSES